MKVLKFGGSSVGSAEGRENIKTIVNRIEEQTIVVVSALGGITDMLLAVAKEASMGDTEGYENLLQKIETRHFEAIKLSVNEELQAETITKCKEMLEELALILKGVSLIKDLSAKTEATIVAYGERLNSVIIASTIESAEHVDSREIFKTTSYFGRHIIDFTLTNTLIRERIGGSKAQTIVMGGFISSDRDSNQTTNLGRGGSDYTASLLAAALSASELLIYTDVDGFMSADPRIIKEASLINSLSFVEAMELCNFGAKVIYPPTIFPAYNSNIPIIICNTYNIDCPGTYICSSADLEQGGITSSLAGGEIERDDRVVKGISSINDTAMLTIRSEGSIGVIGINYRIFKALGKAGISILLVSQSSSKSITNIAIKNGDATNAIDVLRREFAQEIAMGEIEDCEVEKNLATVAIVGERMKSSPEIIKQFYTTLSNNGIEVITSAQGASQTNISFVTKLSSLRRAIEVLHDKFFRPEFKELNLYIAGVGSVGSALIDMIANRQRDLFKQKGLILNVVGIANSKSMVMDNRGLDLSNYRAIIEGDSKISSTPGGIVEEIVSRNLPNSVFVDCTASSEVTEIYEGLLSCKINVVTANKIAASGSYGRYDMLKGIAKSSGVKFLFNTNVGGGLPIIKTINELRRSGDRIVGIKAVISGTLNYLFDRISSSRENGVSFSEAILGAQQAGYSEPDTRSDLSAMDVVRKLVILARESGYRVEVDEVERELLIEDSLLGGSLDEFLDRLPSFDGVWRGRMSEAESRGNRLRVVASMELNGDDNGVRCSVGVKEVGFGDVFYELDGSNNIVLIESLRYREYPLQIRGYGGGEVSAAGALFDDLLSCEK